LSIENFINGDNTILIKTRISCIWNSKFCPYDHLYILIISLTYMDT